MRQSTIIVATVIRVLALCHVGWALVRFVTWAIRPLAMRIYTSSEEFTGFGFADIRDLSEILAFLCFAAALCFMSLPVARAATAEAGRPVAFSLAFSCIRTIAFCAFAFGMLSAVFELIEIPMDHLRRGNSGAAGTAVPFWEGSSFRFRPAFTIACGALFIMPFWVFAGPLARLLSRPLHTHPGA